MPTPTRDRLTSLALRVVMEAYDEAEYVPIERTTGLRLALAWLVHARVAQDWQAKEFWTLIAEHDADQAAGCHGYVRQVHLNGIMGKWMYCAGVHHEEVSQFLYRKRTGRQRVDVEALSDQIWRMCNRYQPGDKTSILRFFSGKKLFNFNEGPSIVHPRTPGVIVRNEGGERIVQQANWGFPVVLRGRSGKQLAPKPVNNARFDKLNSYWRRWAENPNYRCLIPTTRFAEAEGDYGSMTTTWLSLADEPMFAWAGLWSTDAHWGDCYTGVMTDAAPELMEIHDRCPVILAPDEWETWLTAPLADLKQFDRPPSADRFVIERTNVPWSKGGDPTQFI